MIFKKNNKQTNKTKVKPLAGWAAQKFPKQTKQKPTVVSCDVLYSMCMYESTRCHGEKPSRSQKHYNANLSL